MQGSTIKALGRKRGFVLSFEAGVSILIFTLLLLALPQQSASSLKELAATQQANDLLRVWSATTPTNGEMAFDLNEIFGNRAELWVNEKQITQAQKAGKAIATEGTLLDGALNEEKVRIIVYYN